jgi:hypothetical protein
LKKTLQKQKTKTVPSISNIFNGFIAKNSRELGLIAIAEHNNSSNDITNFIDSIHELDADALERKLSNRFEVEKLTVDSS